MKNMLRTTEERTQAVITYLTSIGLRQDEVCNMASISVVLLGLNPETRIKPVVEYLQRRGMPDESIPDLVLKHPRIFEYRLESSDASSLCKGRARIQVDVLPIGPNGSKVAAVNYFRDNATFLESPVSPVPPSPTPALLT
ncbi:mitochondrial transcription termination factor, partial [Haematococcus lacustris]